MHDKFLFAFQMYKSYFVAIIRDANRRVESKSIHISDPTAYIRQLQHVPFHLLPIPHTEHWSWKVPNARRHENEKTSERVAWKAQSRRGCPSMQAVSTLSIVPACNLTVRLENHRWPRRSQ